MKRWFKLLVLAMVMMCNQYVFSGVTLNITQNGKAYAVRGVDTNNNTSVVFTLTATEVDSVESFFSSVPFIVSGGISFNNTNGGGGITNINIKDSTGANIVSSTTISGSNLSSITVACTTQTLAADQDKEYTVELVLDDSAPLGTNYQMSIAVGETPTNFKVTGADFVYPVTGAQLPTQLVFDSQATKFKMIEFTISPNTTDSFDFQSIVISNTGTALFESGSVRTDAGVTKVYLIMDSNKDGVFNTDDGDVEVKGIETLNNNNASSNSVTLTFSESDGANRRVSALTQYLILYDIGPSTNIEVSEDEVRTVKAQISSISLKGSDSGITYGPRATTFLGQTTDVSLAGMVIKDVTNILDTSKFSNVKVAAGIEDIPVLQFKVKAIGVGMNLSKLAVSNLSQTFSNGSGSNGITKLSLYRDETNETFDGVEGEDRVAFVTLGSSNTNKLVSIEPATPQSLGSGNEVSYFLLADFGATMQPNTSVELNIHEDTRATVTSGTPSGENKIGSALPIPVSNNVVTLIDPKLKIETDMEFLIQDSHDQKNLVAGMYDVSVYRMTVSVPKQALTDVSFEFESPLNNAFENGYVSKLSLYLDKGSLFDFELLSPSLNAEDVFLGSTSIFEGQATAVISGVSLPRDTDLKLILLMEMGQEIGTGFGTPESVNVDIRLKRIQIASENTDVAGFFPNPVIPTQHIVVKHQLFIDRLVVNLNTDNKLIGTIATIEAYTSNRVKLIMLNDEPMSRPKFYLIDKNGVDLSSEFNVEFDSDGVTNLSSEFSDSNDKTLNYKVTSNITTQDGRNDVLTDFDVYYKMGNAPAFNQKFPIRLTRSKKGSTVRSALEISDALGSSGSDININNNVSQVSDLYDWTVPSYIESMKLSNGESFFSHDSVVQSSVINIHLKNQGQDIDLNSIQVTRDDVALSEGALESSANDTFSIDPAGIIKTTFGATNGRLTIKLNDSFGTPLQPTNLYYYTNIEDRLEIHNFYVYPNPYSPTSGSSTVQFGATITAPANIEIYVYNAMGREVARVTSQVFDPTTKGYFLLKLDGSDGPWNGVIPKSGDLIGAGTYFLRMIATPINGGSKVMATTKWAVF